MTAGIQCDTCRVFSPSGNGWLTLARLERTSIMEQLFPGGPQEYPPAFCTWKCLADYAIVRTLVEGQPAPEEPAP